MAIILLCVGWTVSSFGDSSTDNNWVPRLLTPDEAAEGFYPLFNGINLDGWWIYGTNKQAFKVQNNPVTTTGQGNGNWLFSSKIQENFLLRFEYCVLTKDDFPEIMLRVSPNRNPPRDCISFREGHLLRKPHTGSEKPSEIVVNPPGEWNLVEILCNGPHIRTMMNGNVWYDSDMEQGRSPETNCSPLNQFAPAGHIVLQDSGKHVEFRKIRLKPLSGGPGWRPLLNGNTPEGWYLSGKGKYEIRDGGVLRLMGGSVHSHGEFCTLETFADVAIRMSIRLHPNARSGLCVYRPGVMSWKEKFIIPIDHHAPEYGTGSLYQRMPALELRAMDDAWMQMEVIMRGVNIQVSINGKTVADYVARRVFSRTPGRIGLRVPDRDGIVDFKDIEVKPLQ